MTTRSLRRALAVLSLGLVAVLAPMASASASCAVLERQLAGFRASAGIGTVGDAARRQRVQLDEVRRQARSYRCGEDGGSRQCRTLLATIAKMQAHLVRLDARSSGGDGSRGAARIRALMVAEGCTGASANKRQGKAILASLGRTTTTGKRRPKDLSRRRTAKASAPGGGTFRTLCVRTCDGYFFPISFSTTADRFEDDAAACAARCPGMEVGLYAHPMPNADVDTMVSALDGTPYRDLKTAFLYKLKGVSGTKACGCTIPATAKAPGPVTPKASAGKVAARAVAIPTPRPDLLAELQLAGMMRAAVMTDGAEGLGGLRRRAVRVVGPSFFPER